MRWGYLCLVLTMLAGCSSTGSKQADATDSASLDDGVTDGIAAEIQPDLTTVLPDPEVLWPGDSPTPEWSPWFLDHSWVIEEFSTWSFAVDTGAEPPHFRYLPDHAVGNGHVFSLLGYTYPLNTLHSMSGPYYHKGERFFSDVFVELAVGTSGHALSWQEQGSGKLTTFPLAVTWARAPQARLLTVDFAPLTESVDDPARRALVRLIIVHNPSTKPVKGLVLSVNATSLQAVVEETLVETVENRSRTLRLLHDGVQVVDGALQLALADIPAEGDVVVPLAVVFEDEDGQASETVNALEHIGIDALLEQTRAQWEARLAPGARLTTPDKRVNDYLASQLLVVLSQQAYNGSSHPMCEYTRTWLRDNAGPARLLTRIGLFELLRSELDYLHLAGVVGGAISNSYNGFFLPEDAGPEPDWANMPTITGRSRAESPSYIPLMFYWYYLASGQGDFIEPYFEWMKFALEGQMFDGDLLPFSTDETFRTAMAVAHGLVVDEQFEEGFYSANSSILWVAAAERLALLAEAIGRTEDAESLRTRADAVRQVCDETFLADNGHYHPYVYSADSTPSPAPFEDVNTKPLWTGYLAPDDPAARANLAATIEALEGEDGVLVSPIAPIHQNLFGLPIAKGVHTGMSPGYYLTNLALTDHPLGQAAFNALALHATASATTPEYQILDDHAPLHFLYDSAGAIGDYTARYRPWEGGILADSAWGYLLGNRADALTDTLHLAPHLPNGWSWLDAAGLRVGDSRVDLRFEHVDSTWTILASHASGDSLTIALTLPVTTSSPQCLVDNEPVTCTASVNHWESDRYQVPVQFVLESGASTTVVVSP